MYHLFIFYIIFFLRILLLLFLKIFFLTTIQVNVYETDVRFFYGFLKEEAEKKCHTHCGCFHIKLYVYKKPHTMISVWLHIILGNKD